MDPISLAMLASAGVNAVGKLMGSSSAVAMDRLQQQGFRLQQKSFETQAGVYDTRVGIDNLNTDILNKQADVAGLGVEFAASKERQALGHIAQTGAETLAAQRSYFAGNNLDPTFGSPLLVQAMTAGRISTDMDIVKASFAIDRANALSNEATLRGQATGSAGQTLTDILNAGNARLSAAGADLNAQGAGMKADADNMAGWLGAASALLSGASAFKGGGGMPQLNLTSFGFNPIQGVSGQ
jgi:hypothetical protein